MPALASARNNASAAGGTGDNRGHGRTFIVEGHRHAQIQGQSQGQTSVGRKSDADPTPLTPPINAAVPFSALRLASAQYANYERYTSANPSFALRLDPSHPLYEGRRVRVFGYGREAGEVIAESCKDVGGKTGILDGQEVYLDVRWDSLECVYHIINRVQNKLRIVSTAWTLASNGLLLTDPQMRLMRHPLFKERTLVDLHLIPCTLIQEYLSREPIIHQYKFFPTPTPPASRLRPSDPLHAHDFYWHTTAAQLYRLNAPIASPAWAHYVATRRAADAQLQLALDAHRGRSLCPLTEQVRDGAVGVLSDGCSADVRDVHTRALEIVDGVVPLHVVREVNEYGVVTAAEVYTRIFSPVRPVVVDVNFVYRDEAWWVGGGGIEGALVPPSVPWCALHYRVHDLEASGAPSGENSYNASTEGEGEWVTIFTLGNHAQLETNGGYERGYTLDSPATWGGRRIYAHTPPFSNATAAATPVHISVTHEDQRLIHNSGNGVTWYTRPVDVERVHRTLFGRFDLLQPEHIDDPAGLILRSPPPKYNGSTNDRGIEEDGDDLYTRISRIDTVRLLFAAAGIMLHIQRFDAEDGDTVPDTQDLDNVGSVKWRFDQAVLGALGDCVRLCAGDV